MPRMLCFLAFFLFSGALLLSGQTEAPEDGSTKPKFDFTMNLSLGLSGYEDKNQDQLAFQRTGIFPEFSYGKWGLGLDLTVEFDGEFQLRDLDDNGKPDGWATLRDYLTKIQFLKYGSKGDLVFGRIGGFEEYTLGDGLVMDGYSDTLFYPQVIQLGLDLDVDGGIVDFPYLGFQAVVNDVLDWDILGARLYARPLARADSAALKGLEVGGLYVADIDPQEDPAAPPDDDPASVNVSEVGIDLVVPLIEKEDTSLAASAGWASLLDKGNGGFVGGSYRYQWLTVFGQVRFLGEEFVPAYFDSFYEAERSTKLSSLDGYTEFSVGYRIGTSMTFIRFVDFLFRWEDAIDRPEGPRVLTKVGLSEGALPKLDAFFMYEKKDIDSFLDFFSKGDNLLRLSAGYDISPVVAIVFLFEKKYSPYTLEPADQAILETRFAF